MKRKDLTKTLYICDNFTLKKPFGLHGLSKENSALLRLTLKDSLSR